MSYVKNFQILYAIEYYHLFTVVCLKLVVVE